MRKEGKGERNRKSVSYSLVVSHVVSLLLVVPVKLPTYQAQRDPKEVN